MRNVNMLKGIVRPEYVSAIGTVMNGIKNGIPDEDISVRLDEQFGSACSSAIHWGKFFANLAEKAAGMTSNRQ